jgi:hypothetical protein
MALKNRVPKGQVRIVRSGEGLLRRTRNLCEVIGAVRDHTRLWTSKRVLIQPHWREPCDSPIL